MKPEDRPLYSGIDSLVDPEAIGAAIDEQAHTLLNDYQIHLEDARFRNPDVDERSVFESWSIHKLAAIFVLITEINERLNLIAENTRRKPLRITPE